MKLSLELTVATKPEWVDAVMANLPSFLQDHADCERKASALAMSLVAKYPDRLKIIPELIATGVEELEHFQKVYEVMRERGIPLVKDIGKDPYITALMKLLHSDLLRRFLDRLVFGWDPAHAGRTGCYWRRSSNAAGQSVFDLSPRLSKTTKSCSSSTTIFGCPKLVTVMFLSEWRWSILRRILCTTG